MTSRARMEAAEVELREAIKASRDTSTIDRRIPALVTALVTAALVAGVEAERDRNKYQKSDTSPQISVVKTYNDRAN